MKGVITHNNKNSYAQKKKKIYTTYAINKADHRATFTKLACLSRCMNSFTIEVCPLSFGGSKHLVKHWIVNNTNFCLLVNPKPH